MKAFIRRLQATILGVILATCAQAATNNSQLTVALRCGGLTYDSTSAVFYASVRTNSGGFSNCLVRIEPFSGVITLVTNLPAAPGRLALSAEHRALYVSMPEQNAVRRFDLTTAELSPAFDVGGAAKQLLILPGLPERLAVVRKHDLSLGVYENGAELPPASGYDYVSVLGSGADGSRLFGFNLNTTAYSFYRFNLGATVSLLDSRGGLPLPGANMVFAGGRLYFGSGAVIDPETRTLLGQFPVETSGTPLGHVAPDLARNRIFLLQFSWPDSPLYACEPGSLRQIESGVISNTTWGGAIMSDEAYVHDFQRWGEDGFACRTYDKVHISRSMFVPSLPARDLALSLTTTNVAVTNQQVFFYDITCTNRGPLTATNAVLKFDFPAQTSFVSATNPRGSVTVLSNRVSCLLTNLPTNLAVVVRVAVRVQTTNSAALLANAALSSPAVDLNEDNNAGVLLTMANWRTTDEQFNVIGSLTPDDSTYSSLTRRLYFVFDRTAGVLAQWLVGFDPAAGVFMPPTFLPGDPQKLAISADGQWLEVALRSSGELRRVHLVTGQITNQTSLARWMEIQAKNETTKDQGGLHFTAYQAQTISNNVVLGRFPSVLFHYHFFEPDVAMHRFYQFIYDASPSVTPRLRMFDLNSFRLLDDAELPIPVWTYNAMARWGENGFLLRSDQGLVIWRSRAAPYAAPTDLRTSVTVLSEQVMTNTSFTMTATVLNLGPNPATNVLLRFWRPAQASLQNSVPSAGVLSTNGNVLTLALTQLAVSNQVTITATLRGPNPGVLLASAHGTSQSLDTNFVNDVSLASLLVTGPGGWPAGDTAVTTPLAVNDLVYEPISDRLFASLGSSAGVLGNSVVGLEPATGLVRSFWFVGSEPGTLAMSDDGQFLYAALTGCPRVSRLRLSDGVEDQRIAVAHSGSYGEYSSDLAVQPGHPDTIALTRNQNSIRELAMYRNGQLLPQVLNAGFDIQVFAFNESGDRIFAYGNESMDFLFSVIAVTTNGVGLLDQYNGLLAGFAESFRYEAGFVFGTDGMVFDPIAKMPRGLLPGVSRFAGLTPHVAASRAYGLTVSGTNVLLRAFELSSMTLIGERLLAAAADYPVKLQRCGGDRLAYHSTSSVVVLRSSLVPSGPAADVQFQFRAQPTFAQLNKPFSVQIVVSNAGPESVQDCVVGVVLDAGVTLLSANGEGGWVEDGVWYDFAPSPLAVGQSHSWKLTCQTAVPGLKFLQGFVYTGTTDPNGQNDVAACFISTGSVGADGRDVLPLPARTLVSNPARSKLYAAIPAGVAFYGNSVIEIDPATSTVRGPLFIGSEPVALAVTDDGRALYVSMYGIGGMRRVNLDTWSVDPLFPIGPGVEAAVALAAATNGVVLTHGSDAAVFVGGMRTSYLNGPIRRLLRGAGSRVYGFNPDAGIMPIVKLNATANSLTIQSQWSGPFFGAGVDLRFASGRLFSNRGDVLDPESQQVLGQFAAFGQLNTFAPEPDGRRLYTLTNGSLRVWETTNYQAGATTNVSLPGAATSDLLRWGADGLAFLENDAPVWLRSPLVRTTPATDSDQDGMPDAWELVHALNPNIASDALADSDQDGIRNRDEYLAGTNPQFAEGPLRMFVQEIASEGITVCFAGHLGRIYRIEHTGTLSPAGWQPVADGLVGQDRMIAFTYPISGIQGFLRVIETNLP